MKIFVNFFINYNSISLGIGNIFKRYIKIKDVYEISIHFLYFFQRNFK